MQVPAPSHVPLRPQETASSVGHSWSGSVAADTGAQMPSAPVPFFANEQASQFPVQLELQQTPSAQNPLAQSAPETHASARLPLRTHAPVTQCPLSMQS